MYNLTERIIRLRDRSLRTTPFLCGERAKLMTDFYRTNGTEYATPIFRALAFKELCTKKQISIGDDELIVGERGSAPKGTPTYPEISCHTMQDFEILRTREKTRYGVSDDLLDIYRKDVIPYWGGKSLRDRAFRSLAPEWREAYDAGVFTEFLEQRAPGHTVLDDKVYHRGFLQFKSQIAARILELKGSAAEDTKGRMDQLVAMDIACDAILVLAARYAEKAKQLAARESNDKRRFELQRVAETCSRVPAHAPTSFVEALQMYWFVHLGVVMELNGWDAFSPGHLDHHLEPFYRNEVARGSLDRDGALEILCSLWIKFNNQPAPPKVGVTAQESSTYNDFVNINIGGVRPDGSDGSNEVSHLLLEVVDVLPLLQPGTNIQLSRVSPDDFVEHACRVIRKGYGFPSVFNTDGIIEQMVRVGKELEDARAGGSSGCVETGCFGKEAYILTGYVNLPKILEISLHNGVDQVTGKQLGPKTGDPRNFKTFDELKRAFSSQLHHFVDIKLEGNHIFEDLYASEMPAPFLSSIIDGCIESGKDYNSGGAKYNTRYFQGVGIGTITDSMSVIKKTVFDDGIISADQLLSAIDSDFENAPLIQTRLLNTRERYGNDADSADEIMKGIFNDFFSTVEGKRSRTGGSYHISMLPTTCHIYFGMKCIASADGRHAGRPLSEGISPVQGADITGPTAVLRSAAKMDHRRTGGTLLNMKLMPKVLDGDEGLKRLAQLIRAYFELGGHHVQFNVVDEETLRRAKQEPEVHRNLLVRVAGYSDYFCDLKSELQDEIISRTAHGAG